MTEHVGQNHEVPWTAEEDGYARVAWDNYCVAVGGLSITGDTLPSWRQLTLGTVPQRKVAAAWVIAARAVVAACRADDTENNLSECV